MEEDDGIWRQIWRRMIGWCLGLKTIYNYLMKSESPGRSRVQLSQSELDPLEVNELIVQQRAVLPLLRMGQDTAHLHPLIFKITREKNLDRIVIFLLSEADLYFLYRFDLGYQHIADLNAQYKLSLKRTADFVQLLKCSLEEAARHQKEALIQVIEQGIELELTRRVAGKTHTVLRLVGRAETAEMVKATVAYRYGALRQRIHLKEERIAYLRETVRQKFPHLLKNFKQI